MKTRRWAVVAAVGLLTSFGSVTGAAADPAGVAPLADAGVGQHECAEAVRRCEGRIWVPLNWDNPASGRISVAFAWVPRRDRTRPAAGTVLALSGGPTAALPVLGLYETALGPLLDRQNMLMVDPRGLGQSSPLRCPGLDLNQPGEVGECARQLGPSVQFFTTDQAVRDLDAVRAALGVTKVTVYGTSYGTLWGQAYASRFPERVRAAVLDSVVRTDRNGYAVWPLGSPVHPGVEHLDAVCRPSWTCRRIPGDSAGNFTRLVARLRAVPDPALPVASLTGLLTLTSPAGGREINAAVAAYLRGDPWPLRRLARPPITGTATGAAATGEQTTVPPGYFAYLCADSAHPYSRTAPSAQRRRQLDAAYAAQDPFRPFTVAEIRGAGLGGQQHEDCLHWPTPRPSPAVAPDAPFPGVPVVTIGGELDFATPAANAAAVAERFPRGKAVVNRFGAHNPALGAASGIIDGRYWRCALHAVRTLLAHPEHSWRRAGRLACSAETWRSVGSFPLRAAQIPAGIQTGPDPSRRTLVAAAVATAADALARRNPANILTAVTREEPGLRGGRLAFPDARTVDLDQVRFVSDLTVRGRVRVDGQQVATARLTVVGTDGVTHTVTASWPAFRPKEAVSVVGTLDSHPFLARLPLP